MSQAFSRPDVSQGHTEKLRLAIVVPRFGDLIGGAELHARWLAEHLATAGHAVEVFTTCATDHTTWENALAPGVENHHDLTVRRYLTDARDTDLHTELELAIRSGLPLTKEEEIVWLRNGVSSQTMEDDLVARAAQYDYVIAIPYLFGTTYFAARACPGRTLLIPCLHDEPYAYLGFVREMLSQASGIMFNTAPEAALAQEIVPNLAPWALVAVGFDPPGKTDGEGFLRRRRIATPSLLFVGRRERGKNVEELIEYFVRYKTRRGGDLSLVAVGSGEVVLPSRRDIVDLAIDWKTERDDLYASATAVCQPSLNESLSIVLMQAWLAARPVLVHGQAQVTRYHCERSNGGLWYSSYAEFEEVLDRMIGNRALAATLGRNGRDYVEREYSWETVLDRFHSAVAAWRESSFGAQAASAP
jgi:glycosyltransferase involved in cell wall biosynthesis